MIEQQFFTYMVIVILAFGIQGSLQSIFARRNDGLAVAMWRNLSLSITMLPLLLFAPEGSVGDIQKLSLSLLASAMTGSMCLWTLYVATRYIPLGIGTAIRQITSVVLAIVLGAVLLSETLAPLQMLFLGVTVALGIILAVMRSYDDTHLNVQYVHRGIFLSVVAGILFAVSFYFFSVLSRGMHPFVAAYVFEASIGACLLVIFVTRRYATGIRVSVPPREIIGISGSALFTIIGTCGFALAVNSGPYALASGLLTMNILVTAIMGWILFREKTTHMQLILMIVAIVGMILLKISS